jgi:hypothetical protein
MINHLSILSLCVFTNLSIYGSTALFWILAVLFNFLICTHTVRLLGRGISPSQGRYLNREQQKQNKRTQTSMLQVRIEPTIPVFERSQTVHALARPLWSAKWPTDQTKYEYLRYFMGRELLLLGGSPCCTGIINEGCLLGTAFPWNVLPPSSDPEEWTRWQQAAPKRWQLSIRLNGVTTQK